ncbi:hypothetical protein ACJ73_00561 [Blastomyces percursus]|uniref:Uncharacterized protein n=1 Tax=Blastomyces percursus TaxID=1658174 RepID=A0A1J9RHK2_9EURO|nr:hypothetical protein ACJ73_00561 [Blastomyces percursus]
MPFNLNHILNSEDNITHATIESPHTPVRDNNNDYIDDEPFLLPWSDTPQPTSPPVSVFSETPISVISENNSDSQHSNSNSTAPGNNYGRLNNKERMRGGVENSNNDFKSSALGNLIIQHPDQVLYRMEKQQRELHKYNASASGTAWSETDPAQALDEWIEIVDRFKQEKEERQAEADHTGSQNREI